jgi:hypothetical protein
LGVESTTTKPPTRGAGTGWRFASVMLWIFEVQRVRVGQVSGVGWGVGWLETGGVADGAGVGVAGGGVGGGGTVGGFPPPQAATYPTANRVMRRQARCARARWLANPEGLRRSNIAGG